MQSLPQRADTLFSSAARNSLGDQREGQANDATHRRRLLSTELLDGEREIEIEHAGAVYRLRRTSLGKLILTK